LGRIFLVEDNAAYSKALRRVLRRWRHQVEQAWTGEQALELLENHRRYDVALIDWNLPGRVSGLEVCRRLRALSPAIGISFLTGRQQDRDKVTGLKAGADDYIVKTTGLAELRARLDALIRRSSRPPRSPSSHSSPSPALCHGPLAVDTVTGKVTVNGKPVELTRLQYRMLLHLMDNRGRPASRDELRQEVLGYHGQGGASSVKFCIHELRGRLAEAGKLIRWKWRQGWYLADEPGNDSVRKI
jgi:DNA-binding response OmpR family regulator